MRTEASFPEARIAVGLCAWDSIKPHTVKDLLALAQAKFARRVIMEHYGEISVQAGDMSGGGAIASVYLEICTLLPVARDRLLRLIYQHDPTFTHVLFIDQDMTDFTVNDVFGLLRRDTDIIAPLMTQRSPPFDVCAAPAEAGQQDLYRSSIRAEEMFRIMEAPDHNGLLDCLHVGTGFCLIKRRVCDALMQDTMGGPVWFTMDRLPHPDAEKVLAELIQATITKDWDEEPNVVITKQMQQAYQLGRTAHLPMMPMGEDVLFCRRAREKGFGVKLDTTISVSHVGDRPWNIQDKMRIRKEQQAYCDSLGPLIGNVTANPVVPVIRAAA